MGGWLSSARATTNESDAAEKSGPEVDVVALLKSIEDDSGGQDAARMETLSSLACDRPFLLQPHLAATIALCCQIVRCPLKPEQYRHSALRVINGLFIENNADLMKTLAPETIGNTVIPSLVVCLSQATAPCVVQAAAEALPLFINQCSELLLTGHLKTLIPVIDRLFDEFYQKTRSAVQEQPHSEQTSCLLEIISVMSAVAKIVPWAMADSVDARMDQLKGLIRQESRVARGTFHLISLIALHGGKPKFSPHSTQVMEAVAANLPWLACHEEFAADFTGLMRMMGADFLPFLPALLPPLITAIDGVRETIDGMGERERIVCEEKSNVMRNAKKLIIDIPKEIGEAFAPYVHEIARAARAKLTAQLGISCACCMSERMDCGWAVATLPLLLGCVRGEGVAAMRGLWVDHWKALKAYQTGRPPGEETGQLWRGQEARVFRSLGAAILQLGPQGLSTGEMNEVGDMMEKDVMACRQRMKKWKTKKPKEDWEMVAVVRGVEEEERILESIVEAIEAASRTLGSAFSPIAHRLLPAIRSLVKGSKNKQWKVPILARLDKFSPEASRRQCSVS